MTFDTRGLRLFENGKFLRRVKSIDEAKEIIAGCDESMACVDCDPQDYVVKNSSRTVYERKIEGRKHWSDGLHNTPEQKALASMLKRRPIGGGR